jgi:hypothetical protein
MRILINNLCARSSNGGRPMRLFARLGGSCRPGTAATEFAVTCPLLLLLALACCDFGRVAHAYEVVANAARTGAETGATQKFTDYTRPFWESSVRQAVIDELQSLPDFNEAKLSYSLSTTTDSDGLAHIIVELSYPFRTKVTWPGLPHETQLHRRVEFRQFR